MNDSSLHLSHDLIDKKSIYVLFLIHSLFYSHISVKVSQAGSAVCTVCAAGTYADHNTNICVPCPANTYARAQMDVCTPCPLNMYSLFGDAKCRKCDKGYKVNAERTGCQLIKPNGKPTPSYPPTPRPTRSPPPTPPPYIPATPPPTILPSLSASPSTLPSGNTHYLDPVEHLLRNRIVGTAVRYDVLSYVHLHLSTQSQSVS
jgi:Tyrosine-protein kinase ephrin type A/B receptor-like